MKKFRIIFWFVLFLTITTSCSKWIAPPYTSVDKIIKVKAGMTIEQANATLGIDPYDVYMIQEDGSSIYLYNYRRKDRRMSVPPFARARERAIKGEESSQTNGTLWYGETSILYVQAKDGKIKSMITDAGRQDAEFLMLTINNIQVISRDELITLQKNDDSGYFILNDKMEIKTIDMPTKNKENKTVIIPLSNLKEKKHSGNKSTSPSMQKKEGMGKMGKILIGVFGAGALMLIITRIIG